jgi:hypothetical protein
VIPFTICFEVTFVICFAERCLQLANTVTIYEFACLSISVALILVLNTSGSKSATVIFSKAYKYGRDDRIRLLQQAFSSCSVGSFTVP